MAQIFRYTMLKWWGKDVCAWCMANFIQEINKMVKKGPKDADKSLIIAKILRLEKEFIKIPEKNQKIVCEKYIINGDKKEVRHPVNNPIKSKKLLSVFPTKCSRTFFRYKSRILCCINDRVRRSSTIRGNFLTVFVKAEEIVKCWSRMAVNEYLIYLSIE